MVSTATSNQLVNQASVMETVKYSQSKEPVMNVPPSVSLEIKELIKEDKSDSGKTIELEKQESSEDTDLTTEGTESDKSSLDSSSLSKMAILKEMKVEEQIGEKKIKKKFYWYGNHKLVKPIKDIPPRFQLMLAETNAEKARCEGRPIFLQQDSNPNTSSEAARMSTPFNPEAKCFVPHQPYKVKACSNEGTNHPEGKESTAPNTNGEMLTPVTVQSVPSILYHQCTQFTFTAIQLTPQILLWVPHLLLILVVCTCPMDLVQCTVLVIMFLLSYKGLLCITLLTLIPNRHIQHLNILLVF